MRLKIRISTIAEIQTAMNFIESGSALQRLIFKNNWVQTAICPDPTPEVG
jgi:hypothetical protein